MAREFSKSFYNSKEWKAVRDYCLMRDKFLCTKCGQPAEEVHHIIHLSSKNIHDISITLNPDNLTSLCRACHFAEHHDERSKGQMKNSDVLPDYTFDENGYVIFPPSAN